MTSGELYMPLLKNEVDYTNFSIGIVLQILFILLEYKHRDNLQTILETRERLSLVRFSAE